MLGVGGRDGGSAFGRFGGFTEATVKVSPAFALYGEVCGRQIRACLGAASNGCLGRIFHSLMSFLNTEVFRREIGSPDRSRTCIYRFIPATAFAAAFRRLWSGLSHNRGAKRALGCTRKVSTPSKREGRAWLGSGLPCLGLISVTAKCRFPRI